MTKRPKKNVKNSQTENLDTALLQQMPKNVPNILIGLRNGVQDIV
jgi:hypothetical protein